MDNLSNLPYVPVATIQESWWQVGLNNYGVPVTDAADIDQCIRVIINTPAGTDPLRPTFASNIHDYLDWPIQRARPYIAREAIAAIRQWEPRVDVEKIDILGYGDRADIAMHQLVCRVIWNLAGLPGFQSVTEVILTGGLTQG